MIENCETGRIKELKDVVPGDRLAICTKHGQWNVVVTFICTNGDILFKNNELEGYVDQIAARRIHLSFNKENSSIRVETIPEESLNRDIIHFHNYKEDQRVKDVLRLMSLHLNKLPDSKLELLANYIRNDILEIKPLRG